MVGAIDVVLLGRLDEAEAVHIAHIALVLGPEQIEAANVLLESLLYFARNLLLFLRQIDWVANFFSVPIALHDAVEGRTLSRLCMSIVTANRVNLYVEAIGRQELFVNVAASSSDRGVPSLLRHKLTTEIVGFSE